MAYVIAVCGSGGKTTLVKNLAKKYANENKKVCITTTTHMWFDEDVKKHFILGNNKVEANDEFVGTDNIRPLVKVDDYRIEAKHFEAGNIYYIANLDEKKELITPLNETDYKLICDKFDYVIIEADGSRSMPMKIPRISLNDLNEETIVVKNSEPMLPKNVNEIIIVVGMESIGREIGAVCHRFYEFYGNDKYLDKNNIKSDTIVTEELLDDFVKHYYYEPLSEKFENANIKIHKNQFKNKLDNFKLGIVLLAAGFSKRFGTNKLLIDINNCHNNELQYRNGELQCCNSELQYRRGELQYRRGERLRSPHNSCEAFRTHKKLYQLMIDMLLNARNILQKRINDECKLKKSIDINISKIDISVISQYDDILNDKNYIDKVIMIKNENAYNGQSESIKIGTDYFKNYDAIIFVNADMPYLSENEIANFIYLSILNNTGIAAMYSGGYKNPAYFEKKYFDEILKISGDRGPRELFEKYKMEVYKYYISDKYLTDIDTYDDFIKMNQKNID